MRVLLSIKPEYAEKILAGDKRYEFRKVLPKASGIRTVVIYATKPVGKVIGEFEIDSLLTYPPKKLWDKTADFSGITRRFFNSYFYGRQQAHAIKVRSVKRYEAPLDLRDVLTNGVAPQSFCYLT